MKCHICGQREATGYIFKMCDPCFDEFESKVDAAKAEGKKGYTPDDRELQSINPECALEAGFVVNQNERN